MFRSPGGALDVRLRALVSWVREAAPAEAAFVADEDGLLLAGSPPAVDPAALSGEVLRLLRTARASLPLPPSGTLSLGLEDGNTLQIVECTFEGRRYGLGLVTSAPLAGGRLRQLGASLLQSLEQGGA